MESFIYEELSPSKFVKHMRIKVETFDYKKHRDFGIFCLTRGSNI